MSNLFALIGAAAILWLGTLVLLRADAAKLANGLRFAGPTALIVLGTGMLLLGRAQFAGLLISGGLAWMYSARRRIAATPSRGKHSTVRSAALEMELDHDNGSLEGVVLAGTHEGRVLGEMNEADLMSLHSELVQDVESLQLLEAYLDGRFAGWRERAQANMGAGLSRPPASGAMTEKEAYQILGLEPGASAADIRKAHRRLIQRLHPDLGGTSFLAARINEAKDFLLTLQG